MPLPRERTHISNTFDTFPQADFYLYKLREQRLFTDVTFIVSGERFPAHKAVISMASDYYKTLFTGKFREASQEIQVIDVESEVFDKYLDHVYGKAIVFTSWKDALSFASFIKFSQTSAKDMDRFVTQGYVPAKDYLEYLSGLISLYENEVPINVLQKSAKYITEAIDLSELSKDIIKILVQSPDFGGSLIYKKEIATQLPSVAVIKTPMERISITSPIYRAMITIEGKEVQGNFFTLQASRLGPGSVISITTSLEGPHLGIRSLNIMEFSVVA